MSLAKDVKKRVISEHKQGKSDTGSAQVQVALLTERINTLSDHFKANPKDNHSRYGLIKMVSRRKKLLSYIRTVDAKHYQELITRLDLRK